MKVDSKKTYLICPSKDINSKRIIASGKDLEVENGNCRILKGDSVYMGHAVFKDVVRMYDSGNLFGGLPSDHDNDFTTEYYRHYRVGAFAREVYLSYWKIEEFTSTIHESHEAAKQDAAKERFPMIKKKRDELLADRKEELSRPWYRRLFRHSSKSDLKFVEELIEVYEKNMMEK